MTNFFTRLLCCWAISETVGWYSWIVILSTFLFRDNLERVLDFPV